jgi:hypothetical protein
VLAGKSRKTLPDRVLKARPKTAPWTIASAPSIGYGPAGFMTDQNNVS